MCQYILTNYHLLNTHSANPTTSLTSTTFPFSNLKEKFQIYDDVNLLLYLYLRYECINNTSEIHPKNFMSFLVKELFIVDENNGVIFDNHFLKYEFSMENSLFNIFYEWDFQKYSVKYHASSPYSIYNQILNRRHMSVWIP